MRASPAQYTISPEPSIAGDSSDSEDEYGEFAEMKGKTTIQALKDKVEETKVYVPTRADINAGWSMEVDPENGDIYYWNNVTGVTQLHEPEMLENEVETQDEGEVIPEEVDELYNYEGLENAGWEVLISSDGREYYMNLETGEETQYWPLFPSEPTPAPSNVEWPLPSSMAGQNGGGAVLEDREQDLDVAIFSTMLLLNHKIWT